MSQIKALIAMSGGVDSSAAAWLMLQQGVSCQGAMMRMFDPCTLQICGDSVDDSAADALAVADRLGIPFHLFDACEEFSKNVMEPFVRSYESGQTPNPCIFCNKHIKFDYFLEKALELGCTHVVTGHYARIRFEEASRRWLLYKAADQSKDQSYVLACLNQHQLAHTLLPLGELTKEQARAIALEQGFINAKKKDSQYICFVPDGDYVAFMERFTGKQYTPGDFLDLQGRIVGKHRGAVCYTLGQRKGLGLAMGAPVYVCGKDMQENTVTVGPNEALFAHSLIARDMNWIPFSALTEPMEVTARARYNQKEQKAIVTPLADGSARVDFLDPQRAMTPGQAVVLYQGDLVVGSGTISRILPE